MTDCQIEQYKINPVFKTISYISKYPSFTCYMLVTQALRVTSHVWLALFKSAFFYRYTLENEFLISFLCHLLVFLSNVLASSIDVVCRHRSLLSKFKSSSHTEHWLCCTAHLPSCCEMWLRLKPVETFALDTDAACVDLTSQPLCN